jgi:uridine kinase
MARSEDLARVVALIPDRGDARVFVGIDGVDGAGKTTFADALAATVSRPAVRVSVDDFHNDEAVRYRRGRNSPEGFWLDAFDYDRLIAEALRPLRDSASVAPPGAVVIVDGLFLQRSELAGQFDLVVYLDVPFDVTAQRLHARDGVRSLDRYVGASLLYFAECDPLGRADVVIDNR